MRPSSLSCHARLLSSGFRLFSLPVKFAFQYSLTLLLRYRSQVVFRVGSSCLPYSRAISSARYSGYPEFPTAHLYGAVTLSGRPFQAEFEFAITGCPGPHSTSSPSFDREFGLPLCRFRSPLLTASRLISSPPLTKMLQFGGFPTLTGHMGLPMQEVPFGDPRIKGSLRLHEAYRSLARPSSAPEPSHSPDDSRVAKASVRQLDCRTDKATPDC